MFGFTAFVFPGKLSFISEPIDCFSRQLVIVLLLALPEKKTPDIVVQEDRPHQVFDVPRPPLEFTLEVADHETAILETTNQLVKTDMIWFLYVFHTRNYPAASMVRGGIRVRLV